MGRGARRRKAEQLAGKRRAFRRVVLGLGLVVVGALALAVFWGLREAPVESPPLSLIDESMQLNRSGRVDEAIVLLSDYLEKHPRTIELNPIIGFLYTRKNRFEDAARYFEKEIALNPDRVEVYHELGKLHETLGNHERAVGFYQEEARRRPGWKPYHKSGVLLDGLGRREEAAKALEEAVRLGPAEPQPMVDLGKIYAQRGDLAGARELFARAIELRPTQADAHYNLGRLLLRLGEREAGEKALARFRELSVPQDGSKN